MIKRLLLGSILFMGILTVSQAESRCHNCYGYYAPFSYSTPMYGYAYNYPVEYYGYDGYPYISPWYGWGPGYHHWRHFW